MAQLFTMQTTRSIRHVARSHITSYTAPTILCRQFSQTPAPQKRKRGEAPKKDLRISLIRQHLWHPLTPRPLRLSRHRYLRHWTIARAWSVLSQQRAQQQQLELERQWNAMRAACERLRLLGDDGVVGGTGTGTSGGDGSGRLYRQSLDKAGTWQGVPIESARMLKDWPARDGWNHDWKSK